MILFVSAKVMHYLLRPMPSLFRSINYALGALLVLGVVLAPQGNIIPLTLLFACIHLFLLSLQSWYFANPENSLANRLFVISWLAIYLVHCSQSLFFLFGELMTDPENLLLMLMALASIVFQAIAIEAHGKIQQASFSDQQSSRIQNLNYFYHLFQNSAEGLYTSNIDGRLLTINPAMCHLFGYENEEQLLSEVRHTGDLYANEQDRQQLINEVLKHQSILGREIRGRRKDGSEFWFSLSVQLQNDDEQPFLYGSIFDIDAKKKSDLSLEYLASHDSLTGAFNRREFEHQLEKSLARSQTENCPLALLYLDLDQFKTVNDTCGHKAGDQLLRALCNHLKQAVEDQGILARLGGDEFAVLLAGEQANHAIQTAETLLESVRAFHFEWENHHFHPGLSIGVAHFDSHTQDAEQLLSMADAACYRAKDQGRNRIHVYSKQDTHLQRYEEELNWLNLINQALENSEFTLFYQHYQPLGELSNGHHYEILLRMQKGEEQLLPETFYQAADKFQLSSDIDKWVIEHYCRWLASHKEHHQQLCRAHINISGQSVQDPTFSLHILELLTKYQINGALLCFEIKESQAIQKREETLAFMQTLRSKGCLFALDNFGIGLYSCNQLKTLRTDYIKIDKQFIQGMLSDPADYAMVRAIHDVASTMHIQIFAPYVENKALLIELGKMGIHFAQGYGLSMPQPLTQFESYQLTT